MALSIARGFEKSVGLLRCSPHLVQRVANFAVGKYTPPTLEHPTFKVGGIFEPDYLHKLQPPAEEYRLLDIDLKGYDFPVLERYQKYLFKQIRDLGLNFHDAYGHPNEVVDIEVLKHKSENVQEVYHTRLYKRTMQLLDFPTYKIGLLIDIIHATVPPGITFSIDPHNDEKEENRFVPDIDLAESKRSLETLAKK